MTREEFIAILDEKRYSYKIEGDKIIVTYRGYVDLEDLTSLPPGVVFNNGGDVWLTYLNSLPPGVGFKNGGNVYLDSLTSLPPSVEFKNGVDVYLRSLTGGYFSERKGNIEGIDPKRLLNFMISKGVFER
jgi:hypothetical protein